MAEGRFIPNHTEPPKWLEYVAAVSETLDLWRMPTCSMGTTFTVAVHPERVRPGIKFNYTRFLDDGNLHFLDDDVVPTPYEMCLLYQLVAEYKKKETNT